jgi:hypothetical protein
MHMTGFEYCRNHVVQLFVVMVVTFVGNLHLVTGKIVVGVLYFENKLV